jgi:hypothetical protein
MQSVLREALALLDKEREKVKDLQLRVYGAHISLKYERATVATQAKHIAELEAQPAIINAEVENAHARYREEAAKVQELESRLTHRSAWQERAIAWRAENTEVPEAPIDKLIQAQRVNDELDRYAREHPQPEAESRCRDCSLWQKGTMSCVNALCSKVEKLEQVVHGTESVESLKQRVAENAETMLRKQPSDAWRLGIS